MLTASTFITMGRIASRSWRIVGIGILLLGAGIWYNWASKPDVLSLIRDARKEFLRGEHSNATLIAEQILTADPDHVPALILAGDAAFAMEQFDQALSYYRRVPAGSSEAAVHATLRCGRIEMHHTGNAMAAEADFLAALKHVPEDQNALFQLASLLGIQARRSEAVPLILQLFRQGSFHIDLMVLVATDDGALFNIDELQRYENAVPDSASVMVGRAWHAKNSGDVQQAIEILKRARSADPQLQEAVIVLAQLLWESRGLSELRAVLSEAQTTQIHDARLWLVRGLLAEMEGNPEGAARCFWEALRLDPSNRNATYKLFQHFTASHDLEAAEFFQQRIDMLLELRTCSDLVTSKRHEDAEPIRQLVQQLENLGRVWEAWGWCVVARDVDPNASWAVAKAQTLFAALQAAPVIRTCVPVELPRDLSELPVPNWDLITTDHEPALESSAFGVTFQDSAKSSGLVFQYFNDRDSSGNGQYMYQFNGGGCGVLDYDLDGWPDIHLTQGCRWNAEPGQQTHVDQLFRNSGNGQFLNVTSSAGLIEDRFSTGVAAGDFDNDGFPDVYVANIGHNRLFRNNGDGTFSDATAQAQVDDPAWSTSCVMADLNGDSFPDIYSVNYLEGDGIFETICQHDDGRPRMCMPFHFPGAQDQLYFSTGDGRFRNATDESGVRVSDAKGLGVIAADFQGDGKLSLFVANDTVPNTLFLNQGTGQDSRPVFEERGMSAGIALNHAGRAEGCMGIAVGDSNNDGGLDVFVTNFYRESNTLYRSLPGMYFADQTAESGLEESSLPVLGFGTQFLDADLNGHLDLLVANGHIDDYRPYGRPYQMQPQFYYNSGQGRFVLQPAEQTGDYFTQRFLGRSLARWDWNRDGREDAVISNLDQPVALLTNTTQQHGRFLAVNLRGVQSARDAIGATVTLQLQDQTISRQLTAGDGYQASNQRQLVFGLSNLTRVHRMDVAWPSGKTESWYDLEVDAEYQVTEGCPRAFRIR